MHKILTGKLAALAALVASIALSNSTDGAIVLSGDIEGSGGTFEITQDITFDITSDGSAQAIFFDEWVTSDGVQNNVALSSSLSYQINGGPIESSSTPNLYDNLATTVGDVTPNDGYLYFGGISVTSGDTLTIKAGSWSTTGDFGFNPDTLGTFTGDVFLSDGSGIALSGLAAVPEPETWTLAAGLLALGVAVWHRRRRTA